MTAFDPWTLLAGLLAGIQDNPAAAGVERGLRFLAGAYSVVWTILGTYLVILSFRLRRVARQVRRLRERLGL